MIRGTTNKILSGETNFLQHIMSKKQKNNKSSMVAKEKNKPFQDSQEEKSVICLDKSNNVLLHIYAKPGAKQNKITGITAEGLNIQINAPPTEGAANTELVKFIASVLDVPKSNVSLERGHKSRIKVVRIEGNQLDSINQKILKEIEEG